MLQNIRERIKGWIAGLVIVIIGSAFLLFGVEYYVQQNSAKNAVLAKVDGKKITEQEVEMAFRQIQKQEQSKGLTLTNEQNKQLKQFALDQLINHVALVSAAEKAGLFVSLDQAKDLLMQVPALQVDGQFSTDRLQQMVYNSGLSPADFFKQVQNSILLSQVQSGIEMSEFVLPSELSELASLFKQTRSFSYLTIPISNFQKKVKVSDAQVKSYYTQNIEQFRTPEKVQLSYLILSPADLKKNVSVTEEEIKQYFGSNPANFSSQQRWQVNRYLIPLSSQAGKSAIEEAKAKSEKLLGELRAEKKPSVKPDLSWITQDQISGQMGEMMAKLKQGDISPPFRTTEGVNIIQVVQFEPAKYKSFDSVKSEIKNTLKKKCSK